MEDMLNILDESFLRNLSSRIPLPYPHIVTAVMVQNRLAHDISPDSDEIRVALRTAIYNDDLDIFDLLSSYCVWTEEMLNKTLTFCLRKNRPHFVRRCLEIDKENFDGAVSKQVLEDGGLTVNVALQELIKQQQDLQSEDFVRFALKCNVPEVIGQDAEIPEGLLFSLVQKGCLKSVRFLVEKGEEVKNSHVTKALAAKQYETAHYLSERLSQTETETETE
jgi:hypothetical protein